MNIKNVNVDWLEINSNHYFDISILDQIYQEKLNIQQLNIQEKVLEFDFFNFSKFNLKQNLIDFLNKCDLKVCKQATSYYSLQLKVSDFFTIYLQTEYSKLNNNCNKNIKIISSSILNLYFCFEDIREMTLCLLRLFKSDMNNLNLARTDYCIDTVINYSDFENLKEESAYNLRTKKEPSISHHYSGTNFTGIAYKFTCSKFFRIYDKLQECIEADIYGHKENMYFKKYLGVNTTIILKDDYNADLNKYYRETLRKVDSDLVKYLEKHSIIYNNFECLNKLYRLIFGNDRLVRFEYELKRDALKRLDINFLRLENIKYLVIENLISATPVSIEYSIAKNNMEYYTARSEKEIYEQIKNKKYNFDNDIYNEIFKNDNIELKTVDLIFRTKYLIEFTAEKLKKSFKRIKNSVKNHFIRLEAVRDLIPDITPFITYFEEIKKDVLNFELKDSGVALAGNEIFVDHEDYSVFQELHRKKFEIKKNNLQDLIVNIPNFYFDYDENFNALYQV